VRISPRSVKRWGSRTYRSAKIDFTRWVLDQFWSPEAQERVIDRTACLGVTVVKSPASLEPRWGYAVHGRLGLIDGSATAMAMPRVRDRKQRSTFSGLPTLPQLLHRRRVQRVSGIALSVRNPWEHNYYHATFECFTSLAAFAAAGLLEGNTLVVGKRLAETPIGKEFIARGGLASTQYVIQDNAWVVGDRGVGFVEFPLVPGVWMPQTGEMAITDVGRCSIERTLLLLESVLPPRRDAPDAQLYVTRGSAGSRQLRNEDAVMSLLRNRGFRVVDPGTLSWSEQVDLFRRASVVAGVHGAALTNCAYRWPKTLKLLELAEPRRPAQHYRLMAKHLGFEYACVSGIRGVGRPQWQSFDVDIADLAGVLDGWDARP
jgi:hypothetical protein